MINPGKRFILFSRKVKIYERALEMNRILIVETDFKLAEKLSMSLTDAETSAMSCGTMEAATALLENEVYQMVIIDTELQDGNGYDLIYEIGLGIYKSVDPIIIAIVPNHRKPDNIELIEQGISEYITKPFSTAVLKAKINTQFRRRGKGSRFVQNSAAAKQDTAKDKTVRIDQFAFDFGAKEFRVADQKVELDDLEQSLLRILLENKGSVLKRRALSCRLRSESKTTIDEASLAKLVQTLSEKLSAQNYIKTVYGIGYMWAMCDDKNKKKW